MAELSNPAGVRFSFAGMNLRSQADALLEGKFSCAQNVRDASRTSLSTRPGYVPGFSTGNNAVTDLRSYAALGTDDKPRFLARDTAGVVWLDNGASVAALAGTPGRGVRMIPFRPSQSPQSWMYVADQGDYQKISAPAGNNAVTAQKVGIAEPQLQCEAAPSTLAFTDFSAPANNWVAAGTMGTPTDENRTSDTTGTVFSDPINSNRSSIQVSGTAGYVVGQTISVGNNNASNTVIQDVLPPASTVALQAIRYASGNNGSCILVPAQLPVGQNPVANQFGYLRRGALIKFSGNNETALVLDVTLGPDGSQCVETLTAGTHTAAETITGIPTIVADGAFSSSQAILSQDVTASVSAGIGTLTQTLASNPFSAVMGASGSLPQQDDYFHFSIAVSDYTQVLEVDLRLNVDATDTTVTANYYQYVISQAMLAATIAGATSATQDPAAAGAQASATQSLSSLQQQLQDAQNGTGNFAGAPAAARQSAIASIQQAISSISTQTASTASSTAGLSAVAVGQWTEVRIPISAFTRVGGDESRSLSNCNAVQVRMDNTGAGTAAWAPNTSYSLNQELVDPAGHTQKVTVAGVSGTIQPTWNDAGGTTTDNTVTWTDQGIVSVSTSVRIGSFWVGGGGLPDVSENGAPYRYRVVPFSSLTGAKGNPSPDMRYGVSPRRQKVQVNLPSAAYDSQIDTWLIQRYGGTVTSWRFIGSCPVASSSFSDDYFDDTAEGGSLMEANNFEPWPSVDGPFNPAGATIRAVGNEIIVSGPSVWPATILNWLPGTILLLGGKSAYTLRARPVALSGTSYLFQVEECAGYVAAASSFVVSEPVVARSFAPWAWGPDAQGTVFAVGDPLRPGWVNFSKPYAPDVCPNAALELTPPSEPLIGGETLAGLSLVASTNRWWALYPAFQSAQLYSPVDQTVGRGLVSPFGICTDGAKIYFWAKDCIASTSGGPYQDLTSEDLYPLFPHEGVQGASVVRNGVTFYPPDYSQAAAFRLRTAAGYLFADYVDAGNIRRTLVMSIATGAWMSDAYADPMAIHYSPEQQEGTLGSGAPAVYSTLLLADTNGKVWTEQAGASDNGVAITCVVGTRELDGQAGPSNLWRNQYLDYVCAGAMSVVPTNLGSPATTPTAASSASRRFDMIPVGSGANARFLGLQISWSGTAELYEWVYQGVPNGVFDWATQPSNLGLDGFKSIYRIEAGYIASEVVTLTIASDGISPAVLTLPSTGGAYRKTFLTLTPNKGELYSFATHSSGLHQLILPEFAVWVSAWGRQGQMIPFRGLV